MSYSIFLILQLLERYFIYYLLKTTVSSGYNIILFLLIQIRLTFVQIFQNKLS